MKKTILEKIRKTLKNSRRVLILCHVDPDGDTIGSSLGLYLALTKIGCQPTIYSVDGVPRVYRFLPGADQIVTELAPDAHYDCAITVDASDLARLGNKIKLRELAKTVINIDHHPDNSRYGDINYVEPSPSVGVQIYHLCRFLKIKIDKNIADNIYTAIITDTGNFRYENTTGETFKIAAELLRAGVKTHELTSRIYDNRTLISIKVTALAMSRLQFTPDHKVCWSTLPEAGLNEIGVKGSESIIGIVDLIRSVEGVEIAILLREEKGKIKINFRAKSNISVGAIARQFGGGGHAKAAGAIVVGELAEVTQRVIAAAAKYLKAASYIVR